MIAHNPLHGSGQAGFPHPALALGADTYASQGIGMTDRRHRQPASDEAPHVIPKDAAFLAAPRKRAMPKPSYLESEKSQRRVVHGHSVISDVSTHHRLQPLAYTYSFPILQHAGPQPFLDEPHYAPVCNPMLDELHKPFVRKAIEKGSDVQIEHPVHFLRQHSRVQRIQRLMLAAPWSEPVRKSKKVRFVDSIQHLD